ncbi:MAG: hypothetical protein ABJA98_24810 [Acidobacteriota bacterium]
MTAALPDTVSCMQSPRAMATRLGHQIHGLIGTLGGHQWARVPRMTGLSPGLASTLRAAPAFALASREAIRGRRLRGGRRVLLSQRELSFEIRDLSFLLGDLLGLFGDLSLTLDQCVTKAFNLLRQTLSAIVLAPACGPRHASHGTPIGSICTAP